MKLIRGSVSGAFGMTQDLRPLLAVLMIEILS